jgi:hypothetical protein
MEAPRVDFYTEPPRVCGAPPSIAEVLHSTKHLQHAGKEELEYFLENPDEIPTATDECEVDPTDPKLFCGEIEYDNNNNEYVTALYYTKRRGWQTEKYWLSYPILPSMVLTIVPKLNNPAN